MAFGRLIKQIQGLPTGGGGGGLARLQLAGLAGGAAGNVKIPSRLTVNTRINPMPITRPIASGTGARKTGGVLGRAVARRVIGLVFVFGFIASVKAEVPSDLIKSTLLDHVAMVTQFRSGETKLALTDSLILIGNKSGRSIVDLQVGLNGNAQTGEAANFTAGGFLKVSSLIQDTVTFPEHWKFLNSIEHGPELHYDFREREWFGGYQVGLAFALNPTN